MHRPGLPFEVTVSRLLSGPYEPTFHLSLTLLDTLSDLDLYFALDEEYHPHSDYTLKQSYYASSCLGTTGVSPFGPGLSRPLCPLGSARPQLEFRPGYSLFARRYWGNLVLISFPGLTDMLKFGPWSRAAQVTLVFLLRDRLYGLPAKLTLNRARGCPLRYSRIDNSHRAEARRHQFRSVLRSSSMSKPRDPLLLVLIFLVNFR